MKRKTTNGKPHVKVIPAYQRPGSIQGGVIQGSYNPGVYNTKPFKAKPRRADFISPPVPPTPPPIPIVQYSAKAWDSMRWLVVNCPTELGWVGAVEQVNEFLYIIHDLRVMDQQASAAYFKYDDWNTPVTEMIVKKSMTAGMVDANLGHSHVNMSVSPSGTDEEQMMDLAHLDKDDKPTSKFSIQTIHNKKGDSHCSVYDWEHGNYYDKCKVEILSTLTAENIVDLKDQLTRVGSYSYAHTAGKGRAGWKEFWEKSVIPYSEEPMETIEADALEILIPIISKVDIAPSSVEETEYIEEMTEWEDDEWELWYLDYSPAYINTLYKQRMLQAKLKGGMQ